MSGKQYFQGDKETCAIGSVAMGQTESKRIVPIKVNDDGSIGALTVETFKMVNVEFETPAVPMDGNIGINNLISPYTDDGSTGYGLQFAAGVSGSVFGAKLMLQGIAAPQEYRLYLFLSANINTNFNNGGIASIGLASLRYIGSIDFSSNISTGTDFTVYDGYLLNPLAFSEGDGKLYAVLQNNNGANVTIPPTTQVQIQLSVLSK